jgi:UDP-N-acetylglucosamine 2-epimerase
MYDSLLQQLPAEDAARDALSQQGLSPQEYLLVTVHRAANTDDPARLGAILQALAELSLPVVFPIHPRTRKAIAAAGLSLAPSIHLREPLGYHDMLTLERYARTILTDSGGVQKEAFFLGVPCVTLREETEWPETVECGWNVLAGADPERIVAAAKRPAPQGERPLLFGDGHAAEKIVRSLEI